jgi:hypothetical protein
MARVSLAILLIGLVAEIAAIVSCALTPEPQVRAIPKPLWLIVILLFPVVGAVLWFVFGRDRGAPVVRRTAPDDDPDFLRNLGRTRQAALPAHADEETLRRLEQEFSDPDPAPAPDPTTSPSEADDEDDPGRRRG